MKQTPTGIEGLDKMLNGGLPTSRSILVCGGPGSGKTILSWQFLYHGAVLYNEPGLYVSLDEDVNQLKEELKSFGWSMKKLKNAARYTTTWLNFGIGHTSESHTMSLLLGLREST